MRLLVWIFLALSVPKAWSADPSSKIIRAFRLDELHETAPDFTIIDGHEKHSQLKDYRGKAVLLHFWATWCSSCRKELPELGRLSTELDSRRWIFLAVSADHPAEQNQARALMKQLGIEEQFHTAQDLSSLEKYLTWGLPVTYLVSPSGEIVARALGSRAWTANPLAVRELNALFASEPSKTSK